jgi:hypothetical protein
MGYFKFAIGVSIRQRMLTFSNAPLMSRNCPGVSNRRDANASRKTMSARFSRLDLLMTSAAI